MKKNIPLLKRLRTRFLRMRHPKHFDMTDVATRNECGTAMCIDGDSMSKEKIKGWQPRDTAPINESVLVYVPHEHHYGEPVYRAIWVESDYLVNGAHPRHWQITGLHMGSDVQDERISHWMPLPESASLTERQEP